MLVRINSYISAGLWLPPDLSCPSDGGLNGDSYEYINPDTCGCSASSYLVLLTMNVNGGLRNSGGLWLQPVLSCLGLWGQP
jgi:hypothetical protein